MRSYSGVALAYGIFALIYCSQTKAQSNGGGQSKASHAVSTSTESAASGHCLDSFSPESVGKSGRKAVAELEKIQNLYKEQLQNPKTAEDAQNRLTASLSTLPEADKQAILYNLMEIEFAKSQHEQQSAQKTIQWVARQKPEIIESIEKFLVESDKFEKRLEVFLPGRPLTPDEQNFVTSQTTSVDGQNRLQTDAYKVLAQQLQDLGKKDPQKKAELDLLLSHFRGLAVSGQARLVNSQMRQADFDIAVIEGADMMIRDSLTTAGLTAVALYTLPTIVGTEVAGSAAAVSGGRAVAAGRRLWSLYRNAQAAYKPLSPLKRLQLGAVQFAKASFTGAAVNSFSQTGHRMIDSSGSEDFFCSYFKKEKIYGSALDAALAGALIGGSAGGVLAAAGPTAAVTTMLVGAKLFYGGLVNRVKRARSFYQSGK